MYENDLILRKVFNHYLNKLPKRYHEDFKEMIMSSNQTTKTITKNYYYLLDDIIGELNTNELIKATF